MKTNKTYKVMTNNEVKKAAKAEAKAINTNPTYLMRKLNKFSQGKETDLSDLKKAQEVSVIGITELYNRLEEAFAQGGFWWGSIFARQGMLLTSCKEVKLEEGESDMTPLYQRDGFVWTEVVDGKLYSFKAAAVWSFENIISSASMMLRFAEARAKQSGNLFSWQQARKDAKKKASKKSKTSKKSGKSKTVVEGALFKAIQELQANFAKGKMTKKQLDEALTEALKAA
ncbi:MAG: hypothetical protein IKQ37_06955 [Bacteroidaceae bacterium]|nr:hypothetical protein [Bacteroidaceae bacterium]